MIRHKWTKKYGWRYVIEYYGGNPKKQRNGGTFSTLEEAQKALKDVKFSNWEGNK